MRARSPVRLQAFAMPGAVLLAIGLRFSLLHQYAVDLPFHDQWDAEGLHLLRPWKSGADLFPFLFRFHNEHHPVLTKLIALMFASVDGMWSALPQMLLDTIFQGGIVLLVSRLARRELPARAAWFVTACAAVTLALPLLWENLLWGFQSQFYLAILLGLLHLDLVWAAPKLGWRWAAGALVGVLTLGTIAAGFLPVLAGGLVALMRLRNPNADKKHAWATLAVAVVVTVAGAAWINPVPYPAVAKTPFSALEAFFILDAWPFGLAAAALLVQLPAIVFLGGQFLRAGNRPNRPWLVALVLWLGAIAAAFAFGRAELISSATPRYCDFLSVQMLIGLVCLLQLVAAQTTWRRPAMIGAGLWVIATGAGLALASREVMAAGVLGERAALQVEQQKLVRAFVQNGDKAVLADSRPAQLIHASPEQRAALLQDPGIRSLLPPSVRAPLLVRDTPDAVNCTKRPFDASDLVSAGWNVEPTAAAEAHFLSGSIVPENFPLLRFRVAGGVDGVHHRLNLIIAGHAPIGPLATTHGESGQYLNFPMPPLPFRIEASADAGSTPFSFSEPVSFSRFSWLAGKLFGSHLVFSFAGALLLVVSGAGAWSDATLVGKPDGLPASPKREQLIFGTLAVGLAVFVIVLWPKPFAFSQARREQALLNATDWDAKPVAPFRLAQDENSGALVAAGAVYPAVSSAERFFGTYGPKGDADIAEVASLPFTLEEHWLCIPIVGYPVQPANRLSLEVLDAGGQKVATYDYSGPNPGEHSQLWLVDVGAHVGATARLHCVDHETGHQGWLGFSIPWQVGEPALVHSWQRTADSNRLGWLRWCGLLASIAAGVAWWRARPKSNGLETHPDFLWP